MRILIALLLLPFISLAQRQIPTSAPHWFSELYVNTLASASGTDSMLVRDASGRVLSRPQPAGGGVTSVNGNTGAITIDTTYISSFHLKTKSLFSATSPMTYSPVTGVFAMAAANGSTNGYLSSTDWNTFNNKVSSQWSAATGGINYTTNNVGINQTTPTEKLHIVGNALVQGYMSIGTSPSIGSYWLSVTGPVQFGNIRSIAISEYADNAAALTGGLQTGQFYRTGDVLKIVH